MSSEQSGAVIIRDFTAADMPAFAAIFREIVAAGESYAYPEDLSDTEISAMWWEQPPGRTVVALDAESGVLLGSAKMGPNRPGRGDHVGTASFMVGPAARGRGVGRTLAQDCIDWHRREGFLGIQFNAVVQTNTAAVALWQDLGFTIIGTVPGAYRSARAGRVGLHVMYLDLGSSAGDG